MTDSPLTGVLVLVIDDNPDMGTLLSEQLHMFGARVMTLTSIDSKASLDNGPDVVLIDMMLRGPANGVEVAEMLRANGYSGPMIALSASKRELELAEDGLFAARIEKPWDMLKMIFLVEKVVKGGEHPSD